MVPALLKYERLRSPGVADEETFPATGGRPLRIARPLAFPSMPGGLPVDQTYGLASDRQSFRRARRGVMQTSTTLGDLREKARGGWKYYGKKLSTRGGKKPENPWRQAKPSGPWYGHHLGPYSEEDASQEPVSPVDAAARRHDQDYGKIQGRYGMYGRYGAEGGGSWGTGRVWVMNYFEPNVGLHAELGAADAALVARSWTGIAEGLWSGKYRLEYDQGWGMLLSDVMWALGITFIYAGPSALYHFYYISNPALLALSAAVSIADYYGISGGWKYYGGKISEGWKHYGSVLSRGWKYYANKFETGWDVNFDIQGGAEYYGHAISGGWKYYGGKISSGWKFHGGQISGGWKHAGGQISAGWKHAGGQISTGWKHAGGQISTGWKHAGGQISGGWKHAGGQISGGWKHAGGQISAGWKHAGGQISEGWKHAGGVVSDTWKSAGGKVSDWAKGVGGDISRGAKGAGAKISDAWKSVTGGGGGGGGGGCFLTTACVRSLCLPGADSVLDALRAFRDGPLLGLDGGAELVGAYYVLAPRIVERIDASPRPRAEYERIYREVVYPTYRNILAGDHGEAVATYRRGVERLSSAWLC